MAASLVSSAPIRFLAIWPATLVLFLVSPVVSPGSLSQISIILVLSYASILAIAGIGQTLVVQQGGLDLTTPGMMSVAAVLVSKYPAGSNSELFKWIAVAVAGGGLSGLVSGLAITRFRITPFVATLAVNGLLYGAAIYMTKGISTQSVPPLLGDFAVGRIAGIPNLLIIAAITVAVVELGIRRSAIGRKFVLVGANARAARAAGMSVAGYQVGTYLAAGAIYAAAGVLLAGYLSLPGLLVGDAYLLPTVASIVLGGTSLLGGAGSVVATAGGAIFLMQLQQVTLGMGAPPSFQYITEAMIIALGMALRLAPWRAVFGNLRIEPSTTNAG
jgi:ribose transport system permease protein